MQTVTKRNIFKNSIAHVGKITNLVLMCSITNAAHNPTQKYTKSKGARVHARSSAHGRASPSPPL